MQGTTVVLLLLSLGTATEAVHKCVRVTGKVECQSNPDVVESTEISVFDRDVFIFDELDKDDLMARGHAGEDGRFSVEGCGGDVDWVPFWGEDGNRPEPYVTIHHFCNADAGRLVQGAHFRIFRPNVLDIGTIILDDM